MGRRRLEVGEYGTIRVTQLAPKKYRARCEVRCRDGKVRSVQADGPSKTAATDRVKTRAGERAASAGRTRPGTAAVVLAPATPVADLVDKWMTQVEASGDVAEQSLPDYRRYRDIVKEGLGALAISEVTTATVEWFIDTEAADLPSKAANLRRTIRGMMALAIRHDAYDGDNPAREVVIAKPERAKARALTTDELQAYRETVRAWMAGPIDKEGQPIRRGGKPRAQDLLDIVDVQLATGARIGEVLALRWQDVDLEANRPTAHICGTLVLLPGGRAAGGGLFRQEHRKAKDRYTVFLPKFAVATLLRIKTTATKNPHDVIFPSGTGTLRSPANLRTQLRAARGKRWDWVKPHTFRKTVATLVERERSLAEASKQLGHAGTAVTAKHYVERSETAPDLSEVLETLGPKIPGISQELN
ncbi:tyrosine-type recombinase/integrase [Gordonia sp. (in: high G+C Gram-positive bacteria)]|uniref:tyrosine-type recombinase/integrase n=1 Tax=Gordonia sp. (in: high G+C Gram-positive bacteria) TaxID=84139 RepID=UPI002625B427|nr:tyrosine-type recombinase/integrase [Gordonia sp. (in: high G+C Gram-positive bacteria)]